MAGPESLQWPIGRWRARRREHYRCDASWPIKANRVKITPSATAISDCSQELSRRINPVTASPNAVSKPAKRNTTNARGPFSPGFGRPANANQVCGVTRLLWVRAPVGPAPTERPELGPAVARPGQVGRVPIHAREWDSFRRHHPNATTARTDVDLPTH
jgi:hypothetical protein